MSTDGADTDIKLSIKRLGPDSHCDVNRQSPSPTGRVANGTRSPQNGTPPVPVPSFSLLLVLFLSNKKPVYKHVFINRAFINMFINTRLKNSISLLKSRFLQYGCSMELTWASCRLLHVSVALRGLQHLLREIPCLF